METQTDISSCDHEPIHLPGAVQEFGAIAVLDERDLTIVQVSKNSQGFFGRSPEQMLNKKFNDVFGEDLTKEVTARRTRIDAEHFSAFVRYQSPLILVEAEKRWQSNTVRLEGDALDRLQSATTLQDLLEKTADAVANLTGLDRVMIYKFHPDLHGEVVAEKVKPGVDSYMGLHYPATDIPVPARAVFLKNWVRMIPKVGYQPVPLVPLENPVTQGPLDLGISLQRAVSPIHIEYLKNMKVGASLTISLQVQGKLWGLIACHHLKEHYVPLAVREACEGVGRMASALIAVRAEADINLAKNRFRDVHTKLVGLMGGGEDMGLGLTSFSPNLLDLVSSSGSAAALYLEGNWVTVGKSLPEAELDELVDWLESKHSGEVVYVNESLATVFPPAAKYLGDACGILALNIPKTTRNYVLWFRPEYKTIVNWAGKPEKIEDSAGVLSPRGSFDLWTEEVRGKSVGFTDLEMQAAIELRNAIMAIDLHKQYLKEQEARQEAERAARSREELMAVLSHDLKNPIGSIRLSAQFATRFLKPDSFERVREYLVRIEKTTSNMDNLINDILAVTKLEAGHMAPDQESVDLGALIKEVADVILPIAFEKRIIVNVDLKMNDCQVICDRMQMYQVISNLVGNAVKFTPEGGRIDLELESSGPEAVKLIIRDNGPGIPPDNLKNIFDRFWQAHQTKRLGTGLGLAIVKGIVDAHGGSVWAESDGKNGTTFHVSLPYSAKKSRQFTGQKKPESV